MALTLHGTVADNTAVLSRPSAKPLIINGDMAVAQRGTSFTGQTSSLYSVDRFRWVNASQGTWTIAQSTDVPAGYGFANSMKADCTTADASPAVGDFIQFYQKIEGQNLQLLKKGTSSAEAITVAFWIKSNKTGTLISEIYDYDNTRQISKAFTISSADTWEKKVLTFAGDTTGALGNDNAASLSFGIWMGAGSNFTSGTLSTTWTASTNANRAVGTTNFADNTANEVLVTGFQVEVGDFDANSIAPFQHESYGDNLSRCQRYYQRILEKNAAYFCVGWNYTTGIAIGKLDLVVTMRTTPTLICATVTNGYTFYRAGAGDHVDSVFLSDASETNLAIANNSQISGTAGHGGGWYCSSTSSQLDCTAEL